MLKIFTKRDKRTEIEKEIDKCILALAEEAETPEQFEEIIDLLKKRQTLNEKKTVSPDTIAIIAGNLLGIALILGYEKANVITSKALGFVIKGRV